MAIKLKASTKREPVIKEAKDPKPSLFRKSSEKEKLLVSGVSYFPEDILSTIGTITEAEEGYLHMVVASATTEFVPIISGSLTTPLSSIIQGIPRRVIAEDKVSATNTEPEVIIE